jgi:hypothetical protein
VHPRTSHCFAFIASLLLCGSAFAANSGPTYTAKLKLSKTFTHITGSQLTITGKGIDLYSLWNLSAVPTPRGKPNAITEQFGVFTSNGNARLYFFLPTTPTGSATSNLNISYIVKVAKNGIATAISGPSTSSTIKFKAAQGAASKTTFTFVLTGSMVDSAVALLPTAGNKHLHTLAGCKAFTLQIGSATFAVDPDLKGRVKFSQ